MRVYTCCLGTFTTFQHNLAQEVSVISIGEQYGPPPEISLPSGVRALQLQFSDVIRADEIGGRFVNPITPDDCRAAWDFVYSAPSDKIVIQCFGAVSRSSGMAVAIKEAIPGSIWAINDKDPRPNPTIYKSMLRHHSPAISATIPSTRGGQTMSYPCDLSGHILKVFPDFYQ